MSKLSELINSFTFNLIMAFVSIAALAEKLVLVIAARSFAPDGIWFLIWIVIAYHFISVSCRQYKANHPKDLNAD